jgi:hypothetical protein
MFFKKPHALNVLLVALMVSSQVHAHEMSGEYLYLPKTVPNPSTLDYSAPTTSQTIDTGDSLDNVSSELDRIEAIEQALEQASRPAPMVPSRPEPKKISASTVTIKPPQKGKNAKDKPEEIKTVLLDDIISASPSRPSIRIIYNSGVILEGKNIQRFLAMDEGFIQVSKMDRNQVMVKALKYGGTFLNIWDDAGRRTIYVGIVFPETKGTQEDLTTQKEQHQNPFRFSYANDWSAYYFAPKGDHLKRQSYDFTQNFALEGQTPYGYLDTYIGTEDFSGNSDISSYSIGLNRVPTIENVHDVNLRVFDASRSLSPLTMPSTRLRGAFADFDLNHTLGVQASYGQKRSYFYTDIIPNSSSNLESYVDALKLTLFPKDSDNQISLNAAQGFGAQHEDYLTKKVYSIEAHKKVLNTYLNGELAQDNSNNHASLAGAKWEKGAFVSALNFRQINKSYTTISGVPSNQGEIGTIWTTNIEGEYVSEQTVLDVYREYLYYNPNDRRALNFDMSGHLRMPIVKSVWSDTNMYYTHTPGEISPRRNIGLDERISKAINFLGFKNTNVYVGGALQRTRYEFSNNSAYDRLSALTGIQIPLTTHLSIFANYDFSWVHEIDSGNDINPNVFNTGFYYTRQITDQLSGNFEMFYRKETGAKGTTSYLSGEDSAGASLGFSYNPSNDVNMFFDSRARKVWPIVGDTLSYNDLDVRLGLRMSFDVLRRGWDPHGSIFGHVYNDKDGNGRYQKVDQGISGVKVNVGERQVVTDKSGFYKTDVAAKSVLVTPQGDTLPSGAVFSTPVAKTVEVKPWLNAPVDFGFNSQTGAYGLVFFDKNSNGLPDAGDEFVRKIKIILDHKYTSVTDNQGAFYFRNISEGPHVIAIDINSLPLNLLPAIKLENKINVAEGTTYVFHVPLKSTKPKETDKD